MAKVKISLTVDRELLAWIDKLIERRVFANRSHAFETAIYHLQKAHMKDLEWISRTESKS